MNRELLSLFGFILLSIFFGSCQTNTENANVLNQKNELQNQTMIQISTVENDSAEPAITFDTEGNIYVVYVEHETKSLADIYLQKFDKNAKLNGERVRINPEKGQAKAWFGDAPTIKIGSDRTIYVGWTATVASAAKSNANVLNLSVSRDGGKSFDAPIKVNDDIAPTSHGMHSLAIGKDDRVYLAWLDERNIKSGDQTANFTGDEVIEPRRNNRSEELNFTKIHHNSNQQNTVKEKSNSNQNTMKHEETEPNSEVFFAVSSDGGKTFSANKKLSSEVCLCCKTNLAVAENGKIYASWRQVVGDNFRHIAVASSDDNGANFSNAVIVSDDQWQINACPVSGAAIKTDTQNNLKIVWFTSGKAGNPGLYTAESNDGGKTFSARKAVSGAIVSGTPILFSDEKGSFQAIWESDNKIFRSDFQNADKQIGEGANLSATFSDGKLFTAFVKKDGEKRSVWLSIGD